MSKRKKEAAWSRTTKRHTVRWGTCRTCKSKIIHKDDYRNYMWGVGYDPGVEKGGSPTQCDACRDSSERRRLMSRLRRVLVGARITGLELDIDREHVNGLCVAVPHSKEFGGESGVCRLSVQDKRLVIEPVYSTDPDEGGAGE